MHIHVAFELAFEKLVLRDIHQEWLYRVDWILKSILGKCSFQIIFYETVVELLNLFCSGNVERI